MTPLLPHSVRRGLIAAALLAGLALMPSVSFGEKDQRKDERDSKQQQRVAPDKQTAPPNAAVVRPGDRKQVERGAPAVSAPSQRQPAAPQVRSGQPNQPTPVGGWRGDRTAPQSGRSDSYRQPRQDVTPNAGKSYTPPARNSSGDRWGGQSGNAYQYQPRVQRDNQSVNDPYQQYRSPNRAKAPEAQGDNNSRSYRPPRARGGASPGSANSYQDQPRVQRDNQSSSDAYQLYRSPKRVSAPQRDDTASPRAYDQPQIKRNSQSDRGDGSQLYRPPKKTAAPDASASAVDRKSRTGKSDQRGAVAKGGANGNSRLDTGRGSDPQKMPKISRPGSASKSERVVGGVAPVRPSVARGERKFAVPEARFRGPKSDEQVRVVPKDNPARLQTRLRDSIRNESRQKGNWNPGAMPTHDVAGNWIPRDTVLLNRTNIVNNNITINYTKIVNNFGTPGFGFLVAPRFFNAGGVVFTGHHHHTLIFVNFFYPFYFSDPYFTGFWYDGYYPSVYTYFGWCPGWVYPTRVYYAPAEYYYYPPATPYRYYSSGYDPDFAGADRAISDIRRAWLNSDIGPLSAHLTDQVDIRVYFEGEYSYTTTTDDFYQMTLDTLATTQTGEMDFDDPIWISSREVFVTGRQVFYDPEGDSHIVYVSFRLRHLGSGWYLVAIGTGKEPIRHQYTDFRYQ